MAVEATCFASPVLVLVLVLLHSTAVQGEDNCYNVARPCPDVCCGPRWDSRCCFRNNSTNWWTTDNEESWTPDMSVTIAILTGLSLAGVVGIVIIILFFVLVCKISCCRHHVPAYVITTSTGQGIPMVSPKEGYVCPANLQPAAPRQGRQAAQTQGRHGAMAQSVV